MTKAREAHRGPHEITGLLVQAFGVGGIDGGAIVNSKTRIPPRQEQVDSLVGDEMSLSENVQNLVPEEGLGLEGIDVRDGMPRAVIEEDAASGIDQVRIPRTELASSEVGVWVQ